LAIDANVSPAARRLMAYASLNPAQVLQALSQRRRIGLRLRQAHIASICRTIPIEAPTWTSYQHSRMIVM
jgi:hypothetical protein